MRCRELKCIFPEVVGFCNLKIQSILRAPLVSFDYIQSFLSREACIKLGGYHDEEAII